MSVRSPSYQFRVTLFILLVLSLLLGSSWYLSYARQRAIKERSLCYISSLRQLKTISQRYHSVFYLTKTKHFIKKKTLLFAADFTVVAGIDLSKGIKFDHHSRGLTLFIPKGEIFYVDADDKSLKTIAQSTFLAKINTEDFLPLLSAEGDNIKENALCSGIIFRAEQRAILMLEGILYSAGFKEVDVRVVPFPLKKIQDLGDVKND